MITPAIGTSELYKQLKALLDADIPCFIHGSPGIGKSYIVNDIAKRSDLQLIDVRLSQLDAVDLRGIPTIKNEQTKWMPPIFLPSDENSKGILFLDELNSAPLSVQAAIYQLVLDRKIGEYTLPKGWRIICAGNKINDKGIVFKLPSPLINRMVHIVLEAKYDDFKGWAIKNEIHPFIIGFLGFRPDLLSSEVPSSTETNPAFCTPRAWNMLSNIIKRNEEIASLHPIIYGTVGYGAAIEFISFVKVYKTLPNIDAILEGKSEMVPNEPSALYALCAAIIEKYSNKEQAVNLFLYVKHLPVEFNVMLIKDLIVKDEDIAELEAFDAWMEQYGQYII
ncbi:ATP-binding protein [Halarcobacter ebronensis]|uniref:ATPase n=1 Tax=Halarcobacter ebronensis TaxID=1462615 RepID=A0A4Q1AXL5_9BACT|nr:MoxR family ATPase [Halarcobacter ebronensis]QKF82335.1 ATPase, MoxR family [Halarcobacter ebronensis]RXK07636.1 ATPase [Halarcobacter ebronensis]